MRRPTLVLLPLLLAALLLGACGDDDGGDDAAATTTTAAAEEEADTSVDDDTDSTEAEGDDAEGGDLQPGGDTEDGGEGSGDLEAFCTAYDELNGLTETLPNDTLEQLQDAAGQFVSVGEEVVATAPEDVVDDAEATLQGFEDLEAAIADASTLEEARDAAGVVTDDEEVGAAADRLQSYVDESC
ncbi:hypothetical protein PO878_03055 [Iamia majanohamensis]|uniref:Uncharacterized protein n=1 Tax=Iamia majanohamensis TaxID=467976 RepID=A0AAF0BS48_9ACTN|nr:hypothetical protein [Iamia majanohamensis]WCO67701.1 hypothetical protein PO878_03055 [Iamia majanohamensis]